MNRQITEDKKYQRKGTIFSVQKAVHNKSSTKRIDVLDTVKYYLRENTCRIHEKYISSKQREHYILVIDSSASMIKQKAIAFAKGCVIQMIQKQKQIVVSILTLIDDTSKYVLEYSNSLENIVQTLENLPSGGRTNFLDAFQNIPRLIHDKQHFYTSVFIFSDGKITSQHISIQNLIVTYQTICQPVIQKTYIIHILTDLIELGFFKDFAQKIRAKYIKIAE